MVDEPGAALTTRSGELHDSVAAVDLTLTADELRHLNLEDASDGAASPPHP